MPRPLVVLLRTLTYGSFAALATATALVALEGESGPHAWFGTIVSGAAVLGAAAALLLSRPSVDAGRGRSRRMRRMIDLVVGNLLVTVLLAEGALLALQRLAPSRVLWDESSAAGSVLALRGCEAGLYFDYRCNARGYPDDEFFEPAPDDYVVALLADSFGAGSVPWEYNFATVAERELIRALGNEQRRVAIHNFGVNGADMPEYRFVFDTEIAHQPFAQVVLAVFVGNDIGGFTPAESPRRARGRLPLQGWLVHEVVWRLWRVTRGVETIRGDTRRAPGAVPDFVNDSRLEPPFFTEEEFLEIEEYRARFCITGSPYIERMYQEFLDALRYFHRQLGERLLVVVIPDEFQVNDDVWQRVLPLAARIEIPRFTGRSPEEAPEIIDREYPQRQIAAWCAASGARCLDLLPALREAEAIDRTYHLRDTHWNARGNRIAGERLAQALLAAVSEERGP